MDQADSTGATRVSVAQALDVAGCGLEQRAETMVGSLARRDREAVAIAAMAAAAALSSLLLIGEIVAVRRRPDPSLITTYGTFFLSGPFMTAGAAVYVGCLVSALLSIVGCPRLARLASFLTAIVGVMIASSGDYPTPRPAIMALLISLALAASLITIDRGAARRMVGHALAAGAAIVGVLLLIIEPKAIWPAIMHDPATFGPAQLIMISILRLTLVIAILLGVATTRPHHHDSTARQSVAAFPVILLTVAFDAVVSGRGTAWLIAAATYGLGITVIAATSRLARHRTSPELA